MSTGFMTLARIYSVLRTPHYPVTTNVDDSVIWASRSYIISTATPSLFSWPSRQFIPPPQSSANLSFLTDSMPHSKQEGVLWYGSARGSDRHVGKIGAL